MKALMCPQCGATITLDNTREFGFCSYCGVKIQIHETVICEHRGEINLEGVATANSIAKKGFMDLAQENYEKAYTTFEKAQEIDPTNIYVLFGLACAHLDPKSYYFNLLKKQKPSISEEEKTCINDGNIDFFLRTYLYYDDIDRVKYILNSYSVKIDLDLLDDKRAHNDYLIEIVKSTRKINIVDFLLKNGVQVDDLGQKLTQKSIIEDSLSRWNFSTEILPIDTFEKLLNNGLSLEKVIKYPVVMSDKDGWPIYGQHKSLTLRSFFNYELKLPGNGEKEYKKIILKYFPQNQKSGCYVATCVYGSYDCPQVWTLRRFRDSVLSKTWYGRLFILLYYTISPKIVKVFGNTEWFKKLWIGPLNKIVNALNQKGVSDARYYD